MVRSLASRELHARLVAVCGLLSDAVGTRFHPFEAASYRELTKAMEGGALGLAWMPPIMAIALQDRGLATPLVLPVRGGAVSFHSALFTRRARARSLTDLKGLRVAWVDRASAAGYLVPRMHIASNGFDPVTFFSQELFLHDHFEVVDAVVAGRADVGATFCTLEPGTRRVISAAWTASDGGGLCPVDVVAIAGPIPSDTVVSATALPDTVRARVARFFLQLGADARVHLRGLLRADSFRVASAAHFDSLRRLTCDARARGYREATRRRERPEAARPSNEPASMTEEAAGARASTSQAASGDSTFFPRALDPHAT